MSGSDPQQDGGDFDWSYQSIRPGVKDQGVNSLLALLSPSKDLAPSPGWDGATVRRCCGWCASPGCLSMDAFRQATDTSTRRHHSYHRGLAGLLTIVDKCQYQTPVCGVTLRWGGVGWGGVIHPGNVSTK